MYWLLVDPSIWKIPLERRPSTVRESSLSSYLISWSLKIFSYSPMPLENSLAVPVKRPPPFSAIATGIRNRSVEPLSRQSSVPLSSMALRQSMVARMSFERSTLDTVALPPERNAAMSRRWA